MWKVSQQIIISADDMDVKGTRAVQNSFLMISWQHANLLAMIARLLQRLIHTPSIHVTAVIGTAKHLKAQ